MHFGNLHEEEIFKKKNQQSPIVQRGLDEGARVVKDKVRVSTSGKWADANAIRREHDGFGMIIIAQFLSVYYVPGTVLSI